jgi:hypothetical protein
MTGLDRLCVRAMSALVATLGLAALAAGQSSMATPGQGSSIVLPRPAWRPFRDPIELHDYWWALLVPMALGVALVYKAVRNPKLERFWQSVAVMTTQVIAGMVLLGVASYLIVMWFIPFIADWATRAH